MEPQRVHDFLRWLVDAGLESPAILEQQLYTNDLIDITTTKESTA
jgi:hypothetical protein